MADSVEQGAEDLERSWAVSRRIGWAIDTGVPSPDSPAAAKATLAASRRHARLVSEREALAAVIPADPGFAHREATARVRRLEQELEALEKSDGWGVLRDTPVGEAAIALSGARNERKSCLARAEHAGLRERRQLRRQAERAAQREGPLRQAFERLAAPERARIGAELPDAKRRHAELEGQRCAMCTSR